MYIVCVLYVRVRARVCSIYNRLMFVHGNGIHGRGHLNNIVICLLIVQNV